MDAVAPFNVAVDLLLEWVSLMIESSMSDLIFTWDDTALPGTLPATLLAKLDAAVVVLVGPSTCPISVSILVVSSSWAFMEYWSTFFGNEKSRVNSRQMSSAPDLDLPWTMSRC